MKKGIWNLQNIADEPYNPVREDSMIVINYADNTSAHQHYSSDDEAQRVLELIEQAIRDGKESVEYETE